MATLLSFAFVALAFGLIGSAPVPGDLAYFNINPLGDIQALYKPDILDRFSPLINDGFDLERYGEPYLLKNAAALGEDGLGFLGGDSLDGLGGLGGGLDNIIGGSGGILDGGTGGILDGDILDGGILGGGSGGILDDLPDLVGGDNGFGGIFGGSGGILDNLPLGGGSGDDGPIESLSDGGIPAGDGFEYLIGNYDSGSGSSYGSESEVPGSNITADTFDSGAANNSSSFHSSDYPSDYYSGPGPTDSGFSNGSGYSDVEYSDGTYSDGTYYEQQSEDTNNDGSNE